MEYNTYVLENGIRLIHKHASSIIAHAGLFVNAGSRDEALHQHGLAHFIEHVIFKGTQKRKPYHIISRLEDVGGDLNAYTTKEETCVHASFLKEDTERAIELINDIFFNSIFPEKEIEKEKEIVIDEINSYKDNPSELIFDDFEEMLFPNNPLGRNILGTPEGLKAYKRADLINFLNGNYHTNEIILCFIGDISFNKLVKLFLKYFSHIPANIRVENFRNVTTYEPIIREDIKNTYQAHCIIGMPAFSYTDSRRITMHLLNNILGGPGMNSRLNLSLREKHGCTYNVESSYNPYVNSGAFSVYFGTDKDNLGKCIKLIFKEFNDLKENKLGDIKLLKAKKQLMGQMAIASESNENMMLNMGKSFLVFGKVDSLEEIYQQIHEISAQQLLEVANAIFDEKQLSRIIYK
jgi:predicted Zn-dependent peptidase